MRRGRRRDGQGRVLPRSEREAVVRGTKERKGEARKRKEEKKRKEKKDTRREAATNGRTGSDVV